MRSASNQNIGRGLAWLLVALLPVAFASDDFTPPQEAGSPPRFGSDRSVGCKPHPRSVQRLLIDKPGVYENFLVDGQWLGKDLVKINADNVTLRHCEIRNGLTNGVSIYAKDVVVDSCKVHHMLAGTFGNQDDAHGITGRPTNLTIRNCEVFMVSGDCVQFDPDRGRWDNVLIESCTFWTGPLADDAAGFKKGERPGENAIDTKQLAANPRSRITIRNCLMYGWKQPGQIDLMAALNLKNNVEATVERCLLFDSEVCFRLRGRTGEFGGARVTIRDCAVYRCGVGVRMEDGIEDLKIIRLGIGDGVTRKYQKAGGDVGAGLENIGEYSAPALEKLLEKGLDQI